MSVEYNDMTNEEKAGFARKVRTTCTMAREQHLFSGVVSCVARGALSGAPRVSSHGVARYTRYHIVDNPEYASGMRLSRAQSQELRASGFAGASVDLEHLAAKV